MKLLILEGPNLNLLGEREPEIYGALTLDQLHDQLCDYVVGRSSDHRFTSNPNLASSSSPPFSSELEPSSASRFNLDWRPDSHSARADITLDFLQSNHEGALIDALHAARLTSDGVVFNPGAFTHYAWALRDAVAAIPLPVVEVHLTDPATREPFRHVDVLDGVVAARYVGLGTESYRRALDYFLQSA
ncbi:MAG: 3-dehydroquinate dehydratase, partial [Actinomycetes bacterium]|nr:3-dehydroquinate dehydratase [Actinomycetes bacterium]